MTDKHYPTPSYLLSPQHPITVQLIGVGGTGSHVLMGLAAMNNACKASGHPGFHVTAWDPDKVESHNVGRQYFSNADVGLNKSAALVTRINRMYGIQWTNMPKKFNTQQQSNIYITCVDSIKSRRQVHLLLQSMKSKPKEKRDKHLEGYEQMFFWLDAGNSKDTGQIVVGTLPYAKFHLPNFFERYPDIQDDPNEQEPSCSMLEALGRQDLFVNKYMAMHLNNLFWRMFRTAKVDCAGLYLNLGTLTVSKIPINANVVKSNGNL